MTIARHPTKSINIGDFQCPGCGSGVLSVNESSRHISFSCGAAGAVIRNGETMKVPAVPGSTEHFNYMRSRMGGVKLDTPCPK